MLNESRLNNIMDLYELGAAFDKFIQEVTKKHGESKIVSDKHSKP